MRLRHDSLVLNKPWQDCWLAVPLEGATVENRRELIDVVSLVIEDASLRKESPHSGSSARAGRSDGDRRPRWGSGCGRANRGLRSSHRRSECASDGRFLDPGIAITPPGRGSSPESACWFGELEASSQSNDSLRAATEQGNEVLQRLCRPRGLRETCREYVIVGGWGATKFRACGSRFPETTPRN